MIRIAVIEDEPTELAVLARMVSGWPGYQCVGAYRTAETALKQLALSVPDLAIVDLGLPRMDGVRCVWKLREKCSRIAILVHTIESDAGRVFEAIQAGAAGYLLKGATPEALRRAVEDILGGGSVLTPSIARHVLNWFQGWSAGPARGDSLTQREQQVLALLSRGYRNEEIARGLGIGVNTVKTHIRRLYEVLHIHSRSELFARLREWDSKLPPDGPPR